MTCWCKFALRTCLCIEMPSSIFLDDFSIIQKTINPKITLFQLYFPDALGHLLNKSLAFNYVSFDFCDTFDVLAWSRKFTQFSCKKLCFYQKCWHNLLLYVAYFLFSWMTCHMNCEKLNIQDHNFMILCRS